MTDLKDYHLCVDFVEEQASYDLKGYLCLLA